ncbi:hypothetical protein [Clavibacter tessellarius]|uniref:hypothetical protein n=1 Tax=Clavibacter tessellarius TaxID=31965 RepID=UPI003250C743
MSTETEFEQGVERVRRGEEAGAVAQSILDGLTPRSASRSSTATTTSGPAWPR